MKFSLIALQIILARGWTTNRPTTRTVPTTTRQQTALQAKKKKQTPFTFPDDECMDLCEHWDEYEEPAAAKATAATNRGEDDDDEDDIHVGTKEVDPHTSRIRMQMVWELWENQDGCDVDDIRSCGDECTTCGGVGEIPCRFCQGSKVVSLFEGHAIDCPVCQENGHEVCKACRGTGWIAGWTALSKFA